MKKIFLLISSIFFLVSCEDVVDIPLKNGEPKLVIDASLKWQKGTSGSTKTIKLSLTNDFYSNQPAPATGATVQVLNSSNTVFNFTENSSGTYICTNFAPAIDENYTLKISYKGEVYTSSNKLLATPPILNFQQENVPGFGGKEEIQIKFFYQDNGSQDNYYLVGAIDPNVKTPRFGAIKDEFFQGNVMFGVYREDTTKPGDKFTFSLQGMTLGYFNYMRKLLEISGAQGGGNPFATPPATLRGNIINTSNNDNYPLGYFHLSEIDEKDYIVQ